MANFSQIHLQKMLTFLDTIRKEHKDDYDALISINEIEKELSEKKYGLVWEHHEEPADVRMRDNIPVFTECKDKEIAAAPSEKYNFILEGDNLHSLRLLEKTHLERIDVIYIDPPYNTENNDFIYNDTYVDKTDGYRHSKWLSFMSERLIIAKKLLKPNGAMAISIGYHQVNVLMLLCQEIFGQNQIMCVTIQTSGGKQNGVFNITHEYIVFIVSQHFHPNASSESMQKYRSAYHAMTLAAFNQKQRPNQAYPIFIDARGCIVGCGQSLQERIENGIYTGAPEDFVFDYDEAPEGTTAVWPVSAKGEPCVWRLIPQRLLNDWENGYIKVVPKSAKHNKNKFTVQYLSAGILRQIKNGELETYRVSDLDCIPTVDVKSYKTAAVAIPTIWTDKQYYTVNGTKEIRDIFGEKAFPYPKPLALIVDILKRLSQPDSVILDFFAGSGTTGHAVMKLNAEDGGHRQFILCTNNENNICEEITYERIKHVINGYVDTAGIQSNVKYFRTDFVSKESENLKEELLTHISEIVELENGIKLDGREYLIVLSNEDAEKLEEHWSEYTDIKALYISKHVLLTVSQRSLFSNVKIHIIPDDYFKFEMQEMGEAF